MKTLIIGFGEVGNALYKILRGHYNVDVIDTEKYNIESEIRPNIMHVCIPYSEKFKKIVQNYQDYYAPKFTVIHSTVPVGTCRALNALHSPIRGIHPHLEKGILTFEKMIGGEQGSEVADYFRRAGMKVVLFDKQETTELAKLLDTEYYRTCIEFCLKAKKLCDKFEVPFAEAYTIANETYNKGYTKLNHEEFVRPILTPIQKPIGGHCVRQNKKLLGIS